MVQTRMCFVSTLMSMSFALPALAETSRWTGTYQASDDTHGSIVKRINITDDNTGNLKIRALITFPSDASPQKDVSIETKANAYRNCNVKGYHDTIIAEFVTSKYKPLMVIKSGPISKHYSCLYYTCYLPNDKWHWYMEGRLYRVDNTKRTPTASTSKTVN